MDAMRLLGLGFFIVSLMLPAGVAYTPTAINLAPSKLSEDIAPSERKIVQTAPATSVPKQLESVRIPAAVVTDTPRTPEEASSARAADRKDASGANITKAPAATGLKP